MTSSLFTALSGLQAHENWIAVIGNNLANQSTPGFKSARAVFSDQFSQTLRFASLPTGTLGGRNPMQLGLGVQLSDIGRNFGQGALSNTGRTFDLALNGLGHFMVSDGQSTLYTRVGTFGLDATSRLVDQRTGFRVLGLNGQELVLDTTSLFPPNATDSVSFAGNLPATVTGPLAQVLTSSSSFMAGSPAQLLGQNTSGSISVPVGQSATMDIIVDGGAPITISLPGQAAPYTTQDIANVINGIANIGVTAADAGGALQLTTAKTGAATSIRIVQGTTGLDLAGLLGMPLSQVIGTEVPATGTTALNDLPTNQVDYVNGDVIEISGIDQDGAPILASFVYGTDGTTIDDLVAFVDTAFNGATAAFNTATGQIELSATATGQTNMSMAISDGAAAAGSTNWATHALVVSTTGTGPDTFDTSIEVFDQAGSSHSVTFSFERQDDLSWNVTASSPDGTASGQVQGLRFNQDGSIAALPLTLDFSIQFPNQSPQTVTLELGTPGLFDGITQFGQESSVFAAFQDGYGVGELSNVSVNGEGDIQGFYTNGQIRTLGEIGVATFVNDNGLREVGENLWTESPNSGIRTVSKGSQGKAGQVVGGALEGSNVSVAEEFVRLIEAQRGFQANARVITTTDEVLAELVNLL
jgi:flagellar hook protein FlgE